MLVAESLSAADPWALGTPSGLSEVHRPHTVLRHHWGTAQPISEHGRSIDSKRLALIVRDSIDRQVGKFDDPSARQEIRAVLEAHLDAGHVRVVATDDSEFLNVIVGETWLARVHWQRICKRSDPRLN